MEQKKRAEIENANWGGMERHIACSSFIAHFDNSPASYVVSPKESRQTVLQRLKQSWQKGS